MSKYTAEQVLYAAQLEEATYDGDLIIVQYLRDYASLLREREIINSLHVENDKLVIDREKLHASPKYLSQIQAAEELRRFRERESAKAGVSDEMVKMAVDVYEVIYNGNDLDIREKMRAPDTECMRAALEAVAPMLASTHVNQEPYCYTVEQKNGLSQGAMCRTKVECEASPLFDPENDHVIPLYREPVLASARVPERTSDMTKFVDGLGWVVRLSDVPEYTKRLIEQTRDLLAAAPKPEVSERHHWLCCGALKPDHSDKPRVMPDCFDPERHVWAVSPKPETEE